MDEKKLTDLFKVYGSLVSVSILKDSYTQNSRGFAFVTYNFYADAETAKTKLNHCIIEGRELKVYFKKKATE